MYLRILPLRTEGRYNRVNLLFEFDEVSRLTDVSVIPKLLFFSSHIYA
jgi:hypothetical protein